MSLLEVKNLSKSFGKNVILNDVSFTLEKGGVLAVIGASGSGKTTLLRCLNFLEMPDNGEILLDGKQVFCRQKKYKESEICRKRLNFGLVFQNFNLFPQYTALQNISLALNTLPQKRSGKKTVNRQLAESLLERMGLQDKADYYPFQLSGGQQQRVAIARALALQPAVLCFDEPTSALDPELTDEVLRAINSLKGKDTTMLIVTHEMEFAKNIADKVIFLSEGKIIEQGTAQEIFTRPQNEKTKAFVSFFQMQPL